MITNQDDLDAAIDRGATEVSITGDWPVLRLREITGVTISGDAVIRKIRLDDCRDVVLDGLALHGLADMLADPDRRPVTDYLLMAGCTRCVLKDMDMRGATGPGTIRGLYRVEGIEKEYGLIEFPSMRLGRGPFIRGGEGNAILGGRITGFRFGVVGRLTDALTVSGVHFEDQGNDHCRIFAGQHHLFEGNYYGRHDVAIGIARPEPGSPVVDGTLVPDPQHNDSIQSPQDKSDPDMVASDYVTIRNNVFDGRQTPDHALTQAILAQNHAGDGNTGWIIEDNIFVHRGLNAISIKYARDCRISRNTVIAWNPIKGPGWEAKVALRPSEGCTITDTILARPVNNPDGKIAMSGVVVIPPEDYATRLVRPSDDVRTWRFDGVVWPEPEPEEPPQPEPDPEPEEPPQPDPKPDPKPEPTPDPDHAARLAALEDEGRADRARISAVEGHLRQIVEHLRGTPQ